MTPRVILCRLGLHGDGLVGSSAPVAIRASKCCTRCGRAWIGTRDATWRRVR